jgi:adenylyltransferase/sulfurtransferase
VLGVLPGLLGTLQATEALKILTGIPSAIANTLLLVETNDMQFQKIALQKNKDCPCCNKDKPLFDPSSTDYITQCNTIEKQIPIISAADFQQWSQREDIVLIDIRDQHERDAFHLGGEHIPLEKLSLSTTDEFKNKTVLLYCQSGIRSRKACELLINKNIKALSVEGGITEIIRHKKSQPIEFIS